MMRRADDTHAFACTSCDGKGFTNPPAHKVGFAWPHPCHCKGVPVTRGQLGRATGLDPRTVTNIAKGTARAESALQFIRELPEAYLQEVRP